jgi:hypothetical protein
MSAAEKPDTHQKALSINLDGSIFGSFAEIGAGQEVARWFLRVGGASGTVAKTISAYDKEVSDDLYGAGTRYVSRPRLRTMLQAEWEQLLGQLQASRGSTSKFFSFVDTVSARNYSGTNECHGWMGLRFLQEPRGTPSEVILHLNLQDPSNVQQQEAVGILGVNLIYAVHHALGSREAFLASLFEELGLARMEIDRLELDGPAFAGWEARETHAYLVAGEYAEAVAFPADGVVVPPGELLYKRALVLAPGRFDSVEQMHADLIRDTLAQLPENELQETKGGLGLFCLATTGQFPEDPKLSPKDIVDHVEALRRLGYGALVFREPELYKMSAYANRFTKSRIHFAIGLSVVMRVFEDRYGHLAGSLLEGIARLFQQNVRLSVYPMAAKDAENRALAVRLHGWKWKETDGMIYGDDLQPGGSMRFLYQYLLSSGFILPAKPKKN